MTGLILFGCVWVSLVPKELLTHPAETALSAWVEEGSPVDCSLFEEGMLLPGYPGVVDVKEELAISVESGGEALTIPCADE